jgi:Spy/CpxP family protein refolding chaperone
MALLWSLIFVLGGISGWVGHCLYRNDKSTTQAKPLTKDQEFQKIMDTMARELKLDAQQQKDLKDIFDESRMKYRALSKQFRPQYEAIRNESDNKIRQMLRPEQRTRFEELLKPYRPQKSTSK